MDKVNSTIKSLQCASSLQVNVKEENTEVVHSGGHGSGSVKSEESEETDASKTAQDTIQDNRSESSDEEDREFPVNTCSFSEKKRKTSAANDESTSPKTQKKGKTDKDNSTKSNPGFDERCNQLLRFKEEFGHCNVPIGYADNPSLGRWCNSMRTAYKKIQKGMKANNNLSQGRIERLEEIGFQWQAVYYDETSEKRCRELIAFKEEFGHCNVPSRCANNPSLGQWCNNMRTAYKKIQKGTKTTSNLSQDRIERLEEIGFQWNYNNTKMLHACATTKY